VLQEFAARLGKGKVFLELPQRRMYRYDGIAVGETPAI